MLNFMKRIAPFTPRLFGTALALSIAIVPLVPYVTNMTSLDGDNGIRPGMLAPQEPTVQEPTDDGEPSEPTANEVEIGEPQSALGKAIVAEFGPADFFAGEKAGHDPSEIQAESGRVQEPLKGDMVFVPWNVHYEVDELLSLTVDGEGFWFMVDTSRNTDGYTVLQILLPEHEPDVDAPDTGPSEFTGATAQDALDAAGATWQNNMMPLSGDVQLDLNTFGVKLSKTTAAQVTIKFDGGEYVLKRAAGDQGIYFIW